MMKLQKLTLGVCFGICAFLFTPPSVQAEQLSVFPTEIDSRCRGGQAKVYDECSNQDQLFDRALMAASNQGKALLVSYGAEWCIWCHVFDAHIAGEKSRFEYVYAFREEPEKTYAATLYEREKRDVSKQARALFEYVAKNFVVVHIDYYHAPNGTLVLEKTGAADHFSGGIPFVFSVNSKGQYAGHFMSSLAEIRRDSDDWYRGYDRIKLLRELKRLKRLAR